MIGFFDSGAGGLSVVREAIRLLPDERYIYYSDNAHCPYGEKSREYVTERARAITRHLRERGCGIVTVACNTATAAAISSLRAEFDMPFVGMEPAVKPAAALTRSGVVGVLATAGTLRAEKYHDTRDRWSGDIKIVEHVGEGFVRLVETGTTEGPEAEETVRLSLQPLLDAGADTIVLGCTHYPFLLPLMKKIAGEDVRFIDPAPAAAKQLLKLMEEKGLIRHDGFNMELEASGDDTTLRRLYETIAND